MQVWALPVNIDFWSQWSDKREETLLCHQHPKQNSFDTPFVTLCVYPWISWIDKWWSVMVDFYQVNPWVSQLMRPVRSTRSDLKYALASKHTCFFSDRVRKMNLFVSNGWFLLRPKWPDVKMLGSGKTILDAAGWDERLVHKIMLVLQPRPTYNIHIVWMGWIGDPVEALQLHLLPSQRTSKSLYWLCLSLITGIQTGRDGCFKRRDLHLSCIHVYWNIDCYPKKNKAQLVINITIAKS